MAGDMLGKLIDPVGSIADMVSGKDKDKDSATAAATPTAPSRDDAAAVLAEADAEARRRRAGGRSSTILTSPLGDTGDSYSSRKTLLGQ